MTLFTIIRAFFSKGDPEGTIRVGQHLVYVTVTDCHNDDCSGPGYTLELDGMTMEEDCFASPSDLLRAARSLVDALCRAEMEAARAYRVIEDASFLGGN